MPDESQPSMPAQTQKAPTQRFTDRFERVFVPTVLIADVLLIVVPPLVGWLTWQESFDRGMALLVAASPCALAWDAIGCTCGYCASGS